MLLNSTDENWLKIIESFKYTFIFFVPIELKSPLIIVFTVAFKSKRVGIIDKASDTKEISKSIEESVK